MATPEAAITSYHHTFQPKSSQKARQGLAQFCLQASMYINSLHVAGKTAIHTELENETSHVKLRL